MSARTACCWLLLAGVLATPARAQRVAVEALADLEVWKTDPDSRLLARNDGEPEAYGRLYVWGAAEVVRSLELLAVARAGVTATDTLDADIELELISVRWAAARTLELEAGKILMPIGAFGRRRFSHMNPLIGGPDLYPTQYPWGVVANGSAGAIDYRAALVSLPAVNTSYTPVPGHRVRPVIGIGYTAGPAFRVGVGFTHGAYMSADVDSALPAGTAWTDYAQTIVAADLRFSVGYVDTRAELAWSSYEVPTHPDKKHGLGFYAEGRVTHTPRLFTALRLERYRYPRVRSAAPPASWLGREVTQMNAELGLGYRLRPSTLLKLSYRRDYWPFDPLASSPAPNGYAFAAQLSINARPFGSQ